MHCNVIGNNNWWSHCSVVHSAHRHTRGWYSVACEQ